jgi:Flp pilus assembly protein TadD
MGRMAEAARELGTAAELLPTRPRVQYNLGLALQETGDQPGAERALLRAAALAPANADIATALAIHYRGRGRSAEALRWAERLAELRPDEPAVARLLEEIRAERPNG